MYFWLGLLHEDLHIGAVDYMNERTVCGHSFMCGSFKAYCLHVCVIVHCMKPKSVLGCYKLLMSAHYWPLTLLGSERLTLISGLISLSTVPSVTFILGTNTEDFKKLITINIEASVAVLLEEDLMLWRDYISCTTWTLCREGSVLGESWQVKHSSPGGIWCMSSYRSDQDRVNKSN